MHPHLYSRCTHCNTCTSQWIGHWHNWQLTYPTSVFSCLLSSMQSSSGRVLILTQCEVCGAQVALSSLQLQWLMVECHTKVSWRLGGCWLLHCMWSVGDYRFWLSSVVDHFHLPFCDLTYITEGTWLPHTFVQISSESPVSGRVLLADSGESAQVMWHTCCGHMAVTSWGPRPMIQFSVPEYVRRGWLVQYIPHSLLYTSISCPGGRLWLITEAMLEWWCPCPVLNCCFPLHTDTTSSESCICVIYHTLYSTFPQSA